MSESVMQEFIIQRKGENHDIFKDYIFNGINAKTNVNYRRIIREVKLKEIYVQIH